jgi:hypothetical protein
LLENQGINQSLVEVVLTPEIEDVVSIGGCCLTKREINRYFAPGVNYIETKSGHGHFFDWTGIFDYKMLASIIRTKLSGVFDIENLEIAPRYSVGGHPYPVIINTVYRLRWKHLLEAKEYGTKYSCYDLKKKEFANLYPKLKTKMDYLTKKFIDLKSKQTLYVLANIYAPFTQDALVELRDALIECRDGDRRFSMLVMTDTPNIESFDNVIVREAKNIEQKWNGSNPDQWRLVLNEFSFIPGIWD